MQWFTKAGFTDVKIKRIGPKWYRGVRRHGLIMGCSVTGVKAKVGAETCRSYRSELACFACPSRHVTVFCAPGRRVTPGHGAKAGDDWGKRAERVWLPVPADPGHHGGRLFFHPADIHVAQEPGMAKECARLLGLLLVAGIFSNRVRMCQRELGAVRNPIFVGEEREDGCAASSGHSGLLQPVPRILSCISWANACQRLCRSARCPAHRVGKPNQPQIWV